MHMGVVHIHTEHLAGAVLYIMPLHFVTLFFSDLANNKFKWSVKLLVLQYVTLHQACFEWGHVFYF